MKREPSDFIENLYRAQRGKLVAYAASYLKKHDVAEELVQETFRTAVVKKDELLDHDNPAGWLMATLKNKMRKHVEQHERYGQFFADYDPEWQAASNVNIVRQTEAKETIKQIRALLGQEDYYLVQRLLYYEDTHLAVSQALGISVAASRKRLSRALQKISETFPEKF